MIRIVLEYDKQNHTFKLLDPEFGCVLDDGGQYELMVPCDFFAATDYEDDTLIFTSTPFAHA